MAIGDVDSLCFNVNGYIMIMLEKKIQELGEYFDGVFPLKGGCNGVRVILPVEWFVYNKECDDYIIEAHKIIDNNINKIIFVGDSGAKIVDIMNFIKEVIQNNVENESKKILFNNKVAELTELFKNNSLSKLETMLFKFGKKTKKVEVIQQNDVEGVEDGE